MDNNKTRELWSDHEVRQMLLLMKKNHLAKIANNVTEINLEVYEAISNEMAEYKINKTARQIFDMFNCLRLDFVKLEKPVYSEAERHTNEHLDLLEEIFRNQVPQPMLNDANKNIAQDTMLENQFVGIDDNSDEEMIDESTSENETSVDEDGDMDDMEEQVEEAAVNGQNASFSTADTSIFNDKKCQNYKKVLAHFTKDWKSSQRSLLENLKRQDAKELRNITKQYKNQESLLQRDRQELEKILEKDRQEMKNLLDTFLKSIVSKSAKTGVETVLNVKAEKEDIEYTKPPSV